MHLDEVNTEADILAIDEEEEDFGEEDGVEEDAPDPAFEEEGDDY